MMKFLRALCSKIRDPIPVQERERPDWQAIFRSHRDLQDQAASLAQQADCLRQSLERTLAEDMVEFMRQHV